MTNGKREVPAPGWVYAIGDFRHVTKEGEAAMRILPRRISEAVIIGDDMTATV